MSELHEAVVVTVSTRASEGTRHDTSGPALVALLADAGWDVAAEPVLVPDDEQLLTITLAGLADAGHRLIVTTGGTGLSPTDRTPEVTSRVTDRIVPGLAEAMRAAGRASTPLADLSRGVVAARGLSLIVNVPGSQAGATDSLTAILPILRHAVDQLSGTDHREALSED